MIADKLPDSAMLEDVFQNIRRAAESGLKMHQEVFHQWSHMWPFPTPHSIWVDRIRIFQKQWATVISDLARKHRDVIEKQYQVAIESLDAALEVPSATNPEELRRRTEQLFRKMLDCMREISELQIREFQGAVAKWTDMATKISP